MKSLRLIPALVLFALNAAANVVPPKPEAPASREEVRKQLAAFFAGGGVGDLKKSPGTSEAVQTRIDTMSDEELAQFQKFIADDPDWRNMPKAMAAAIPPDVLKNLERAGADLTARVPAAERLHDDIRTLTTVLRLLPDAKLTELGINRQILDSLDGTFAGLSPLQAAMLQKQISEISGWDAASASAMAALPPALRQGALALAKHGPLTDEDRKELEQFRTDFVELLNKARNLPASMLPSVVPEQSQQQIDHIAGARPEVLFMIRDQLPAEKLAAVRKNVAILDRAAHLTDRERAALETFRADVVDTFTRLQPAGAPDDSVRDRIAQLSPEHLLILKDKLAAVPEWKELPLYYRAVSAPDFPARIAALRGPAPDAAHLSELEAFRTRALQYIEAAAGEEGVDAALVQRASSVVAGADPVRLELFRSLTAEMDGMAPHDRLRTITHFECGYGFDWLCGPVDDILDKVKSIHGQVGDIKGYVDDIDNIHDDLNEARSSIHNIQDRVAQMMGYVVDIDNIYAALNEARTNIHQIEDRLNNVPNLASVAIKEALDKLLDKNIGSGLNVRELTQQTTIEGAVREIRKAFHLDSSTWWSRTEGVTLPDIPCPGAGTETLFGTVGTSDAATKATRYNYFMDKLLRLIPATEISLTIKIPADLLAMTYGFLGVCLQKAAADAGAEANDVLLEGRHTSVTSGIGSLSSQVSQVATTTGGVSVQLTNTYNALVTDGNAQTNILSSATGAAGAALSNQLSSSTTQLSNQLTSSTTQLTNKVDAEAKAQRTLDLRLQVELNLAADEALVMFQLPAIHGGYLELARDTVNNAITSMLASGHPVGQAVKYFNDAQTAISQARWKDAFKSLQSSYREVAE
jgi:hypothetical protein